MAGLLLLAPHPEERRLRRVPKGGGLSVASWFARRCKASETALARLLTMRTEIYLYESGSGESDGFANSFFSSELIGTLRFSPLGGIFCVNHLS